MKASLTVEASLVFPIFLFAILSFLYFFQILFVQEKIQAGITEVAKFSAKYAYVIDYVKKYPVEEEKNTESSEKEDGITDSKENENESSTSSSKKETTTGNDKEKDEVVESSQEENTISDDEEINFDQLLVIDNIFYKAKLKKYINAEMINRSCVVGGYQGLQFFYSSFLTEDDMVDVVVKYKVRIPAILFSIHDISIVQRVRVRGWIGCSRDDTLTEEGGEDEKDEIVYVTETGTVYHATKKCTHLNLSIKKVLYQDISNLRNNSGGKYKSCELCGDNKSLDSNSLVYITNTGDRYHMSSGCSGLKRTIIEIKISEVGSRSPCKRCYK